MAKEIKRVADTSPNAEAVYSIDGVNAGILYRTHHPSFPYQIFLFKSSNLERCLGCKYVKNEAEAEAWLIERTNEEEKSDGN